jgi:hypothetical protein
MSGHAGHNIPKVSPDRNNAPPKVPFLPTSPKVRAHRAPSAYRLFDRNVSLGYCYFLDSISYLLYYCTIVLLFKEDGMLKTVLTTKSGMTVTIEGAKEEIKDIIKMIEEREQTSSKHIDRPIKQKTKPKQLKFTATDSILRLKEEGYFNKPKTLLDIKRTLEEEGHIYPVTTLSGIMLGQVRKQNLKRIKENKNWAYVKKTKL